MGVMTGVPRTAEIELPATLTLASVARLASHVKAACTGRAPVLTLAGAQGVFCRGLDPTVSSAELASSMTTFTDLLITLRDAPMPTLALVDGTVVGGGLGLLAACDVVLATTRSRFALPEALYGFLPGAIAPLLLDRVSLRALRLLVVQGVSHDAAWALAHGLVDEIVGDDALALAARRRIRDLARTGAAGAIPAFRELCDWNRPTDVAEAVRRGGAHTVAALQNGDRLARLRAFSEAGVLPWEAS